MPNSLVALFVDTSGNALKFCLIHTNGESFTYEQDISQQRTHSALLVPLLQEGLQKLNATVSDIHTIYTNIGPGSFTGLRASLTLVRTLGQFNHQVVIYGVPHFACVLGSLDDDTLSTYESITLALDARRNRSYVQHYRLKHGKATVQESPQLLENQAIDASVNGTLFLSDSRNPAWDATIDAHALSSRCSHSWHHAMQRAVSLLSLSPTLWRELDALYIQAPSITMSDKMNHMTRNL